MQMEHIRASGRIMRAVPYREQIRWNYDETGVYRSPSPGTIDNDLSVMRAGEGGRLIRAQYPPSLRHLH